VTSVTNVLVAVVVTSRLTPFATKSCSPFGKGLRKTQFPSDTASVIPAGAPKILSSGKVTLKSGDTIPLFSNLFPSRTNSSCGLHLLHYTKNTNKANVYISIPKFPDQSHAGSTTMGQNPIFTKVLPIFSPLNRDKKALGAFSIPSITISFHFIFPSPIHLDISA
jgi:hypothetical protein